MRLVVAGFVVLMSVMPLAAQEGRTLIERQALDTPDMAVTSFIEAFAAEDYLAAYYMMTPAAKQAFVNGYYEYNVARFFTLEGTGYVAGSIFSAMDSQPDGMMDEVGYDSAQIFDNIVFHAQANGEMPFDLSGARVVGILGAADGVVSVSVAGGQPADLRFETLILYNGDWRIDRITWPGSDKEQKPWGVGRGKVKSGE